jgi:hypothetical protein
MTMSKVHFSSIYSSFGNDPQNQSTALLAIAAEDDFMHQFLKPQR